MPVRLYAMTCGWVKGDAGLFLENERGPMRLPVPSYLLVHTKGMALFDTGLHLDMQTDAPGRLGRFASSFEIEFGQREDIAARLGGLGIDPASIPYIVTSHLHFDHTGGNVRIPNARVIVQRREWEAGHIPELVSSNGYDPRDYDHGHDVVLIDGEHDLFGDGSVVCIPTYGHTPGHQSLRVVLEGGPVVLTADACYFRRTLDELHLPPVAHDRDGMLESLHRLRRLRDAGMPFFYGHDPELWANVPQAPAEL